MKSNYNLGIWVSTSIWHIIKIDYPIESDYQTKTLCDSINFSHFFAIREPQWVYPYYNLSKIPVNKKTLCKTCLKLSKLSWDDIAQYLINIKVGAISAENSKIKQNKITSKLS